MSSTQPLTLIMLLKTESNHEAIKSIEFHDSVLQTTHNHVNYVIYRYKCDSHTAGGVDVELNQVHQII